MIVKTPFVWSTSRFNSSTVKANESAIPIAAALCEASLGTPEWNRRRATDTSFPVFWPQWDALRLARCAYHFGINDSLKAPGYADQAKHFVKCLNAAGGWKPGDKICLDAEQEENLSLKAILDWFTQVNVLIPELVPENNFLLYSRANILNPLRFNKLTDSQKAYFKRIPTWMAGYPDDPDNWNFEKLVKTYQADPARYGKCVIIQYAAAAVVEGLSKQNYLSIECNLVDPEYLATWQAETAARYVDQPPLVTPPDFPPPPITELPIEYDARVKIDSDVITITRN